MATLIINSRSLQTALSMVSPVLNINGTAYDMGWKKDNRYTLSSGRHVIEIYKPYSVIIRTPTCRAEITLDVNENDSIELKYSLPLTIFQSGKLVITNHVINPTTAPSQQNHSSGLNNIENENNVSHSQNPTVSESTAIPTNCPSCKNPNTKRIRLCEWCGNQIY